MTTPYFSWSLLRFIDLVVSRLVIRSVHHHILLLITMQSKKILDSTTHSSADIDGGNSKQLFLSDEKWTICDIGLYDCRLDREVYQQHSVSSEPLSGSQHWRKYRYGTKGDYTYTYSNIQIQALVSCKKHEGFMIYHESSAVTTIVSPNFKDCKDRAKKSSSGPVLFLSFTQRYNNNRPRCLFSNHTPKIIKETTVLSTFFIEINNVEIEYTSTHLPCL